MEHDVLTDSDYGYQSEAGESQERRDGMLSELARKAVASSVSRLVETEGFVREIVKAMSREFAAYIGREVAGLRQEVVGQASDKVVAWLDSIDIAGEVRRSLDGMTFDINLKIHVTDDGVKTSTKSEKKSPRASTRTKPPRTVPPAKRAP